jgi:hypothetical protein
LEIAGYPVEDLANKFGVKITKRKNNNGYNDAEPSRGVAE